MAESPVFDAVIVGSDASGGWVAKQFAEARACDHLVEEYRRGAV
jgi:choline dehydrogenase-like flavoprotein